MPSTMLPKTALAIVAQYLDGDKQSLASLALVNRTCLHDSRKWLFKKIIVSDLETAPELEDDPHACSSSGPSTQADLIRLFLMPSRIASFSDFLLDCPQITATIENLTLKGTNNFYGYLEPVLLARLLASLPSLAELRIMGVHFAQYEDFPLDGPVAARVKNRYRLRHLTLRDVGGPGGIRNLWKILSLFKFVDTLQLTDMNMPIEPAEKCGSFPWHLQVRSLELLTSTTTSVHYWLSALNSTKMGCKLQELRVAGQCYADLRAVSSTVEACFRTLRKIDLGLSPTVYNPTPVQSSNGINYTPESFLSEDVARAWCSEITQAPWKCIHFELCTKLRVFRVALPGPLLSGWLELLQHLPDRVEEIGVQYLRTSALDSQQWGLSTIPQSRWTCLDKLPDRLVRLHTVEFDGFACLECSVGRQEYTIRSLLPALNSKGILKTLESAFEEAKARASAIVEALKALRGGM